ncbi:hypothetical protein Pyrde_1206 [Pyrodictium delaneyi]|uniref:Uncharacterized protein n=1 Tax=Pyrodictium delaneyi TaxID=1273541 RepID=A0A0P0N2V4_9CREN|nr:hypothetical protein Pyrde_1206 [Pyrodictium delaneyi]OWJ55672.1 hypothetical protein Pdsh_02510 [Pyrodictium delaneyi]
MAGFSGASLALVKASPQSQSTNITLDYGAFIEIDAKVHKSILYPTGEVIIRNDSAIPARLLDSFNVSAILSITTTNTSIMLPQRIEYQQNKRVEIGPFMISLDSSTGYMEIGEKLNTTINIQSIDELVSKAMREAGIPTGTGYKVIVEYTFKVHVMNETIYAPASVTLEYLPRDNIYYIKLSETKGSKVYEVKLYTNDSNENNRQLFMYLFGTGIIMAITSSLFYAKSEIREEQIESLLKATAEPFARKGELPLSLPVVMNSDPRYVITVAERLGRPLIYEATTNRLCVLLEGYAICSLYKHSE